MTLIIAGHGGNSFFGRNGYDRIFFVGDTLLSTYNGATQNRDRLIEVYRKVRLLPVKVWTPAFDAEGYFERYLESFNSSCVIAFAGSALTFGHMLNGIQEHLAQLRYTFSDRIYKIVKHCSSEAIQLDHTQIWSEDIVFHDGNVPTLTAEFQMEVISHVIKRALKDVSGHRLLDQSSFNSIRCELAIALYCWKKRVSELFHVEVVLTEEVPRAATFKYRKVANEETIVLGKPIQDQVNGELNLVRNPIGPPSEPKRGEGCDRGGAEIRSMKQVLREHIQDDVEREANYIGGYVDCWEFQHGAASNWREDAQAART